MLKKIREEIEKANRIVISGHKYPDGDCIGAAVALKYMIEKFDSSKKVDVVIDFDLPKYTEELEYLPDIKRDVDGEVDLFISVDVSIRDRVAANDSLINRSKLRINIDHHISNHNYFDINYVEEISSASELVYKFIDILGIELDKKIASYIYLGIINDTGNFRHNNVKKGTFLVAAELAQTGIDMSKIYFALFSKSMKKAEVFSKTVVNGTFNKEKGTMYYFIPREEIIKNGYSVDDLEGASEYMLTIKGVEVSMFIREEEDGMLKGSLRSKKIDVNKIASKFDGGGHILASGFKTDKSIDTVLKLFNEEFK